MKFLRFLTCDDDEAILTLQLWLASVLLGSIRHEKLLWLCGDGDNGKSVFAEIVRLVLGPSVVSTLSMEQLSGKHELAALANAKLNICNEFSTISRRQEAIIKRLASNEAIAIDEKYSPVYSADLQVRLMFVSNSVPYVSDKSSGFWRRVILLQCHGVVPASEKVQGFAKCLYEQEAAGIFNWILSGAVELTRRNGVIQVAPVMQEAVNSQRSVMDPHTEFLKNELVETQHDKWLPGVKILYESYVAWMKARGHKGALSWAHFKGLLKKVYPQVVSVRRRHPAYGRQHGYSGVFWKDSVEQEQDRDERVADDLARRHAKKHEDEMRQSMNEELRRRRRQSDREATETSVPDDDQHIADLLEKMGDTQC